MSAVMGSMAVLIHTFSSGTLAGRRGTQTSRSIGATTYSYFKCIVYDKLLKPRQSFRITMYCDLTYRAAIQDVWGILLGYWGLGGGNEISLFQ